jgi:hypothetical protein
MLGGGARFSAAGRQPTDTAAADMVLSGMLDRRRPE